MFAAPRCLPSLPQARASSATGPHNSPTSLGTRDLEKSCQLRPQADYLQRTRTIHSLVPPAHSHFVPERTRHRWIYLTSRDIQRACLGRSDTSHHQLQATARGDECRMDAVHRRPSTRGRTQRHDAPKRACVAQNVHRGRNSYRFVPVRGSPLSSDSPAPANSP